MQTEVFLSTGRLGAKQRSSKVMQHPPDLQFEMFDNTMEQPKNQAPSQDQVKILLDTNQSIAEMSQILPEDSVQFIDDADQMELFEQMKGRDASKSLNAKEEQKYGPKP